MIQLTSAIIPTWLDRNSLVKPQGANSDSGNGLLYTSVFIALLSELNQLQNIPSDWFQSRVRGCYYQIGCLERTPQNTYGQEQWDDYLGVVVGCLLLKETKIPRQILWYGLKDAFFFNNSTPFSLKSFLGEYVHIWALYACASFPFIKFLFAPFFFVCLKLLSSSDPGGTQLEWMVRLGIKSLGQDQGYASVVEKLPAAFKAYYDPLQPFQEAASDLAGSLQG